VAVVVALILLELEKLVDLVVADVAAVQAEVEFMNKEMLAEVELTMRKGLQAAAAALEEQVLQDLEHLGA
jgi:hypothetical protein